MKDWYQLLGVGKTATREEVKRAYKHMAKQLHPDKGGDKDRMAILNEAYTTLVNPEQRRRFDEEWQDFQESPDAQVPGSVAGYVTVREAPYSEQFRSKHENLVKKYSRKPLKAVPVRTAFKALHSDLYDGLGDLFKAIKRKEDQKTEESVQQRDFQTLTPEIAVTLFIDFLRGDIYGKDLVQVKQYFSAEISKIKESFSYTPEMGLYEGMLEVISITNIETIPPQNLLCSLQKITNYAKKSVDTAMPIMAPLLQNKYFRNLLKQGLCLYWQSEDSVLSEETAQALDGRETTKRMLINLRQQLSQIFKEGEEVLKRTIQYIRLLYLFEKTVHEQKAPKDSAEFFRERAYRILNWIPAFIGQADTEVFANLFLQAGMDFLRASKIEVVVTVKMADERLAQEMCRIGCATVRHETPDVELYVYTYGLKCIAECQFQSDRLIKIAQAMQDRVLMLANVFPFFEPIRSNIDCLEKDNHSLLVMRELLHTILGIMESNKARQKKIPIDYRYADVLYQAYEACLKNWYEEQYDPQKEIEFRKKLMQALLEQHHWTREDIDDYLIYPWILIDRDHKGWMRPSGSLPIPEHPMIEKFRSLEGIELNHHTGRIRFLFNRWRTDDPRYDKVLTLCDVDEMLAKNIQASFFSLDAVSPDMPFHPFNVMRFGPTSLYNTQFLKVMLLADYLLKFFTVGQEVQGKSPYERASLDSLLRPLPEYLKRIITNFHRDQQGESLHRFWIEVADIAIADQVEKKSGQEESGEESGIERFIVEAPKMVVRKHLLVRNERGELVDQKEKGEGWEFYILTPQEREALQRGIIKIPGPAMIFISGRREVSFLDQEGLSQIYPIKDCDEPLEELFEQAREVGTGKVIHTDANARMLYLLLRKITKMMDRPHLLSPEFIFAEEFTAHYDEFAQYFPEFGRLRELSRVVVIIRLINGIRKGNQKSLENLSIVLKNEDRWKTRSDLEERKKRKEKLKPEEEMLLEYQKVYKKMHELLKDWVKQLSWSVVLQEREGVTASIREQLGPFEFTVNSPDILKHCKDLYKKNEQAFVRQYGRAVWNANSNRIWKEILEGGRKAARECTESSRGNAYRQIQKIYPFITRNAITSFIDGDDEPMAGELSRHFIAKEKEEILKAHPRMRREDLEAALAAYSVDRRQSFWEKPIVPISEIPEEQPEFIRRIVIELTDEAMREGIEAGQQKEEVLGREFRRLGIGREEGEVDLKGKCLWVPSAIKRTTGGGRTYGLVYGGVHIEPAIQFLDAKDPRSTDLIEAALQNASRRRVEDEEFVALQREGKKYGEDVTVFSHIMLKEAYDDLFCGLNDEHKEEVKRDIDERCQADEEARKSKGKSGAEEEKDRRDESAEGAGDGSWGSSQWARGKEGVREDFFETRPMGSGTARNCSYDDDDFIFDDSVFETTATETDGAGCSFASGGVEGQGSGGWDGVSAPSTNGWTSPPASTSGGGDDAGSSGGGGSQPPSEPPSAPPASGGDDGGYDSDHSGSRGKGGRDFVPPQSSSPVSFWETPAGDGRKEASQPEETSSRDPSETGRFDRSEITQGFQDHHIISELHEATKDHELFDLAGVDMDSRKNMMFLPTEESLHPTRSVHLGRHFSEYSERIADEMDDIVEQGEAESWTQAQYKTELEGLLSGLRQQLRDGDIALNRRQRPWSKPLSKKK